MELDKKNLLLYAVTDRSWLNGASLYEQVEQAIAGGITFLQLREKELEEEAFYTEALEIQALCKKKQIPFIINDNVKLAKRIGADGVHVGQDDMAACNARKLLGDDKIIGVSAHSVEEALLAEKNGADYLGVGAAFSTNSKQDANHISHKTICDICAAVSIPVVAIGGINETNVGELAGCGICGVAVISAVFAKTDITRGAAELKKQVEKVVYGA
jgi:thiamine-phosphate pyrophosphorylase